MREKGFALPLVLVAVSLGIIVVGVIGYSQLKSKFLQQPQTTSEKSNDETSWRVYNNSDFKFQISYPKTWSLEEDEEETGLLGPEIKKIKLPTFSPQTEDVSVEVRVTILEEDEITLEEAIAEWEREAMTNKTSLVFQGLSAIKYEVKDGTQSLKTGVPLSYTTLIFKRNKVLFEIISFYPLAVRENSLTVFDQMIKTFKFLD